MPLRSAQEIIKEAFGNKFKYQYSDEWILEAVLTARKEAIEAAAENVYKHEFEAGRSFDKQSILSLLKENI